MTFHQARREAENAPAAGRTAPAAPHRTWTGIGVTAGLLMAGFALAALPVAGQAQEPANPPLPAPSSAAPQAPLDPKAAAHATALHLAYVTSPSAQTNEDTEKGLGVLAQTLVKRTSVTPEGVVGIDIERDDLSPFPFIYWPVSRATQPLSEKAQKKLQTFLNNGGVIAIDVYDHSLSLGNPQNIRRVIGDIGVRPLTALPEDHTLKRSFYLVTSLPGSSDFGTIWVETPDPRRKENVSSVIIGENNWASAWAGKTLASGSDEHEKSLRAGINMVLFALTGNYKADQVHLPSLLERLDR